MSNAYFLTNPKMLKIIKIQLGIPTAPKFHSDPCSQITVLPITELEIPKFVQVLYNNNRPSQ